jgi:chromosome segregation ATPase
MKINYANSLADCDYLENLNHKKKKELSQVRDELESLESARSELENVNAKAKEENNFLVNKVEDLEANLREVSSASEDKFESVVAELETLRQENCSILITKHKMEEEIQYLELSEKNQKKLLIVGLD